MANTKTGVAPARVRAVASTGGGDESRHVPANSRPDFLGGNIYCFMVEQ